LPDYKEIANEVRKNALKGIPGGTDYKIKRQSDGEVRFLRAISEYIEESDSIFGIIQDITKVKEYENELREKNQEIASQNEEYVAMNEEYISINEELQSTLEEIQEKNMLLKTTMNKVEKSEKRAKELLDQTKRQNQEISLLLEGAKSVLEFNDFSTTVKKLFEFCKRITGARAGYVLLLDKDKTGYNILHIDNGGRKCNVDSDIASDTMPIRGFRAEVFHKQEIIYINDFKKHRKNGNAPEGHIKIDNVLFAPLIIQEHAEGIIGLANKKGTFTENDKNIVSAFSELAAIALHNSMLLDEVTSAKERAEMSDVLKSAFLANMSHEIRTPMNSIIGFSDLLASPTISEEKRKKYSHLIKNSGEQLLHLINDIVDISKIESNQLEIENSVFNANELLEEVISIQRQSRYYKEKSNLQLTLKTTGKDLVLLSDKFRIMQIFNNLITNALKFTFEGGVNIGYHIKNKEKMVEFYVKDTGTGISEDQQVQIFERFVQADNQTEKSGTGLGLSITKGLVELLGGSISLDSSPGKGSTFSFTIPLNHSESIEIVKDDKTEIEISVLEDKLIYVAEDDFPSYYFVEEIFEGSKAELKHATNGMELLELVEEKIPDLILMDINMPVMDGINAVKKLRKKHKKVPVIAQTAYAMTNERETCMAAGCDDYIAKPIKPEKLLSMIVHLIKNEH